MRRQLAAILCMGIVMAFAVRKCSGQDDFTCRHGSRDQFDPRSLQDVRLILRVANEEFLSPRVPILLDVAIACTSNHVLFPQPTLSRRDEPYHTLEILFASGTDDLMPVIEVSPTFTGWSHLPPTEPILGRLGPRMFWTVQIPVSYDWAARKGKLLSPTGKVRYQARYYGIKNLEEGKLVTDRDLFVESNVASVIVPTPQGSDAQALKAVENLRYPQVLCAAMRTSGADFEPLEQIAEAYPDSIYALYANFALANSLVWKDNLIGLADPDSDELQRAIELMEDVLRDGRFVLQEQAREVLWKGKIHQAKIGPLPFSLRREFPWSLVEPPIGGYR